MKSARPLAAVDFFRAFAASMILKRALQAFSRRFIADWNASSTSVASRMTALAVLGAACAAFIGASPANADSPVIYRYNINLQQVDAASKEDLCENIFPVYFHPEIHWRNTRFYAWDAGTTLDRYAAGGWGFSCIGDSDIQVNDIRHVGQGLCANQFIDIKSESCVCSAGNPLMVNGLCTAPPDSCTLPLEGKCHGGKNNGPACPRCGNPINPANGNKY